MAKKGEISSSGVPASASKALASYYASASTRLREMILKPPAGTAAGREFQQGRAAVLAGQVRDIVSALDQKAAKWIGEQMPAVAGSARELADRQAVDAGVRVPGELLRGDFSLIDQRTVAVFARDAMSDLQQASSSMGATAERLLRKTGQLGLDEASINRILAGGVIEGTPRDTIRALREELLKVNEGGLVTVPTRDGGQMTFDAGYYASMVVRTKTREASVFARHERLQEIGLDLVSIVGRISNSFCTAYLGMIFSLGGKSTKHPAYSSLPGGGPPFHPNCSKSTRPVVEALATPTQLDVGQGVPDAGKLLNVSPTDAQRRFKDLQLRQQVTDDYSRITRVAGPK